MLLLLLLDANRSCRYGTLSTLGKGVKCPLL